MTKHAIFLCAVLLAAATDATFLTMRLASVQQNVETFIAAKISLVERHRVAAIRNAMALSANLEQAGNSFTNKVIDDLKNIERKAVNDINKVVVKAGVEVTDCNKFMDHLYVTESAAISAMTRCIVNKKATARAYVQKIDAMAIHFLENLSAIREEARRCAQGVFGPITKIRAVKCTKRVGLKGTLFVTNSFPSLTREIGNINYWLAALQPSLGYCTRTNELAAFNRELPRAVSQTKACIQQKIKKAEASTTTSTTEKFVPTEAAPTTTSTTEKVVPTEAAPTTTSTTEKVVPTEAAPTTTSTTEKIVPTEATPTTTSTTEKVVPTEAAPTTTSTTEKVVPTEAAPTTTSTTEKVIPTEAAPTTTSTTEKVVPTEAAPTTTSTTEKVVPTEAAPTTTSTTEKVIPTEAAPTTTSTTEKVVPTEVAKHADSETEEFEIIGVAPDIPICPKTK